MATAPTFQLSTQPPPVSAAILSSPTQSTQTIGPQKIIHVLNALAFVPKSIPASSFLALEPHVLYTAAKKGIPPNEGVGRAVAAIESGQTNLSGIISADLVAAVFFLLVAFSPLIPLDNIDALEKIGELAEGFFSSLFVLFSLSL